MMEENQMSNEFQDMSTAPDPDTGSVPDAGGEENAGCAGRTGP